MAGGHSSSTASLGVEMQPPRGAQRRRGAASASSETAALEKFRRNDKDLKLFEDSLQGTARTTTLYSAFVMSARLRYAFFFVCCLTIVFVAMLAFIMSILFSVVLPASRNGGDDEWALRALFFLPAAPFVLLLGSWIIDELADLTVDSATAGPLLKFRRRLAAALHTVGNCCSVRVDQEAEAAGLIRVTPRLRRRTVTVADVILLLVMELLPFAGLVHGYVTNRTLDGAINNYLEAGLLGATVVVVLYFIANLMVHKNEAARATYAELRRTSPQVGVTWTMPDLVPREAADADEAEAIVTRRPVNLYRHLRSEKWWRMRELRNRARRMHASIRRTWNSSSDVLSYHSKISLADESDRAAAAADDVHVDGPRTSATSGGTAAAAAAGNSSAAGDEFDAESRKPTALSISASDGSLASTEDAAAAREIARRSCLEGFKDCFFVFKAGLRSVPWGFRFAAVLCTYVAFSLFAAYSVVPIGLSIFVIVTCAVLLGLLVYEKLDGVLGRVFVLTLGFFFVLSLVLMATALANAQPGSKISVHGGVAAPAAPADRDLALPYLACRPTWRGLTLLDLALLSEVMYAPSEERYRVQVRGMFGSTSLGTPELVAQQDDGAVVHYKGLRFAPANVTVVAVRGTSTTAEAYEDVFLFAGITFFEMVDAVLPISRAMPDAMLERLMAALALPGISAAPSWHPLRDDVARLQREGHAVVLTGHSLGGALAMAMGARFGAPAVAFSSPGISRNKRRFGVTIDGLRKHTTNVIPEDDLVPLLDVHLSAVQHIRCTRDGPACHSMIPTICTLSLDCPDQRQREFEEYCDDNL